MYLGDPFYFYDFFNIKSPFLSTPIRGLFSRAKKIYIYIYIYIYIFEKQEFLVDPFKFTEDKEYLQSPRFSWDNNDTKRNFRQAKDHDNIVNYLLKETIDYLKTHREHDFVILTINRIFQN